MIFGGEQKWGWYESEHKLYQNLLSTDKYVTNLYGYDPRINREAELLWDEQKVESGTLGDNDYLAYREGIIDAKTEKYTIMGFSYDMINDVLTNNDEKNTIGWAGIKWYKPSDKKTESSLDERYAVDVYKQINTIYMGAVNSLAIVVPYAGDYEVSAYDKNGNLLASQIVEEQNFISNQISSAGNVTQTYAKVQLATASNFNLSNGQNNELLSGGCLGSNFVEWGGGLSGAYYEKGVPDIGFGSDCFKSNDQYVFEHSATRITIRPTNSSSSFIINLKKPMPYPNRIILVNLMQLENRKYRCISQIEPCTVSPSVEEDEEE